MPDAWCDKYGDSDTISRRQGRSSHIRNSEDLSRIAQIGKTRGINTILTLNSHYSSQQVNAIIELAQQWEDAGGGAMIIADAGLLITLQNYCRKIHYHLSIVAAPFNSAAINYFANFGVSRVVLPRHLSLKEIESIINRGPDIEYEMLVMNQKCQFIDGLCNFYHGVRLPVDAPVFIDKVITEGPIKTVYSPDPGYEGHGCQLEWETANGRVSNLTRDDFYKPHCGACRLRELWNAGVSLFKIAGRGYDSEIICRSANFLKESIRLWNTIKTDDTVSEKLKRLYLDTFGAACEQSNCYYQ